MITDMGHNGKIVEALKITTGDVVEAIEKAIRGSEELGSFKSGDCTDRNLPEDDRVSRMWRKGEPFEVKARNGETEDT